MYANLSNRHSLSPLSHYLVNSDQQQSTVAFHDGKPVEYSLFKKDVCTVMGQISQLKQQSIAVYYEQAYPFTVNLFALLHSNKKVWIAANNTPVTADKLTEQGCLLVGEWQGRERVFSGSGFDNEFKFDPLDIDKQQLIIFTSGSSGQAKVISKSLRQLQTEIETLESYWGQQLADAQVLATVSHQHIYGLLFRVLWPLAAGRCFHSDMYLSPEPLLNQSKTRQSCWVASPAQLKRLDKQTSWQDISTLVSIFSSGGDLPQQTSSQIYQQSGKKIIEIYGSSETGGIAWRQSVNDQLWTLFDKIKLIVNNDNTAQLLSPYLVSKMGFTLDDRIKIINETQFTLLGRVDRLVKIEEKRLSLNELEQSLNTCLWVEQSHTFVLKGKRDRVATVIVLSDRGKALLEKQGRNDLIKQIRQDLLNQFERVVLPRKWLFIQSIPLTTQGKVNQNLLTELLLIDSNYFPQIQYCYFEDQQVQLELKVLPKLVYFIGHFPEQPVLPGVTQLAWAEYFGKFFFDIKQPFLRMEVIKFKKIIVPDELISMSLHWKADSSKLYFQIVSETDSHSSGRLVYGEQE